MLLEDYTVENALKAYYNEGREERDREIACKMKSRGRPLLEIVEDTGLSLEEVQRL